MPLSDEDVREILRLIDESDVAELRVETHGFSLHVRRGDAAYESLQQTVASEDAPAGAETDGGAPAELEVIAAPLIGTLYRAEAPGAAPFVDVGSRVDPETVVCLIEVMKMMNSVHAGVAGTIVEVCVENAQPVEYGTPLFQVRPD
jgi:acetyl-CoA carboxylase biotin carboxyl carrier protein